MARRQYSDEDVSVQLSAVWRGRTWTILGFDGERADLIIGPNSNGAISKDNATILFRTDAPEDIAIMSVLHEAGHELFPEWETEPDKGSASELGVFERDVKGFLQAFGVDLTPLIGRTKKARVRR